MHLQLRPYLWYKFLNSLFLGLSVGAVFTLYTPLEPFVFSIGGIVLALGLLGVAKAYERMMNLRRFIQVTLLVESVTLMLVMSFLIFKYHYSNVLFIYGSYQLTFMFGSYLIRMETLLLKRTKTLSLADIAKQKGYLWGMVLSYLFYQFLASYGIEEKQMQVYGMYWFLCLLQIGIIFFVVKSFRFFR